jgi:hypothetical protein
MTGSMIDPLPYHYFGGKRAIASVVWERLGNVKTYVEPFFGGGAVFWLRPQEHFASGERRWELLNDIDGMIVNFLRAVYHDPEAVSHYANWHITELDLTARHIWLVHQKENLVRRLEADPEYYDAKIAGWWVWGINNWIGGGWCRGNGAWVLQGEVLVKKRNADEKGADKKRPQTGHEVHGYLSVNKKGIDKARPQTGNKVHGYLSLNEKGIDKARPQTGHNCLGILSHNSDLIAYFEKLSQRLRGNVCKILCGDWKRCLTPCCTIHSGIPVGVFLDPPYASDRSLIYAHDSTSVCFEVLNWCKEKGNDERFRIALCGYRGYYDELESLGWTPYYWTTGGGYSNQGQDQGRVNKYREVVWFSPHCLQSTQQLKLPW